MASETKEVAKVETTALAMYDKLNERLARIQGVLAPGEKITVNMLDSVRTPTGGSKNWELPDGEAVQTIEGVVILRQRRRAYWATGVADSDGGSPPDCSSPDGNIGSGNNGSGDGKHECADCPMAQFNTAVDDAGKPGAGQACKQNTDIFILREGGTLPFVVKLAPGSHIQAQGYVLNVAQRMPERELHHVVTRIGLAQKKSQGGFNFSFATFQTIGDVPEEHRAALDTYVETMTPWLKEAAIENSDD